MCTCQSIFALNVTPIPLDLLFLDHDIFLNLDVTALLKVLCLLLIVTGREKSKLYVNNKIFHGLLRRKLFSKPQDFSDGKNRSCFLKYYA